VENKVHEIIKLLSTNFIIELDFYQGCLEVKHGFNIIVLSRADRDTVYGWIYFDTSFVHTETAVMEAIK